MENWELTVDFKVTGQGKSLFGDGFAVWFTEDHGSGPNHSGHALGNSETFKGLGIFADTYDNHQEDHGETQLSFGRGGRGGEGRGGAGGGGRGLAKAQHATPPACMVHRVAEML